MRHYNVPLRTPRRSVNVEKRGNGERDKNKTNKNGTYMTE